uniref:hypothetical protein n=1 Tax=Candidatus Electrothrix sp. TaxID=2170559 RepID=UPI004056F1E7
MKVIAERLNDSQKSARLFILSIPILLQANVPLYRHSLQRGRQYFTPVSEQSFAPAILIEQRRNSRSFFRGSTQFKHGFFLFVRAITISLFLVSQFYWCIARKALPLLKNIIPVFL